MNDTSSRGSTLNDFAHVRYQVADLDRSIAFYTRQLGFQVQQHVGKAFASVTLGKPTAG